MRASIRAARAYCCGIVAGLALLISGCQTMAPSLRQGFSRAEPQALWATFHASPDRSGIARSGGFQGPLKTLWSYAPAGPGNGFLDWGPVVAGGRVFTPNGLDRVIALDSETGAVVWDAALASNVFSVTLSPDGGRLFATTAITARPSPTVFALNPDTGAVIWNNRVNNQPALGGIESAPVVAGGSIYVAYLRYEGAGGVCAFDTNSGSRQWCWTRVMRSPMSPLVFSQGRLYVSFDDQKLICLDAQKGRMLWSFTGPSGNLLSSPVINGGQVLAAWGQTLYSLSAASGKQQWARPLGASVEMSSPAVYKDILYVGTKEGLLLAFSAQDGAPVWKSDLKAGALNSSPVVDANERMLWIASASSVLSGVNPVNGEVVTVFKVSEDSSLGFWRNSPALCGSRLYIGSANKNLYAIAPDTAIQ